VWLVMACVGWTESTMDHDREQRDHEPFETAAGIYCRNCGESMYIAGETCQPRE
jgi:hypothetical protein